MYGERDFNVKQGWDSVSLDIAESDLSWNIHYLLTTSSNFS